MERGLPLSRDAVLDRADKRRRNPRRLGHRRDEIGGRSLPVRPRDADQLQLARRMSVDFRHGAREGAACLRNTNPATAKAGRPLKLRDDAYRAPPLHVRDEAVAVRLLTADGDEEPTRLHLTRVMRHVQDTHTSVPLKLSAQGTRQLAERNRSFSLQESPLPSALNFYLSENL